MHDGVPPGLWAVIGSVMSHEEWSANRKVGWLYAGIERATGLLKFGGTRMCPICRTGSKIRLRGFSYSPDWRANERIALVALGKPARGKEWFDDADGRLEWLIANDIVKCVDVVARWAADHAGRGFFKVVEA